MGLKQLIFRTSESDREEKIGDDDERQKEYRKWSVKSKLSIKDESKGRQMKESRNDLQISKNNFVYHLANQSNLFSIERNEDANRRENIDKQQGDKQSDKSLSNRFHKISLERGQIEFTSTKNTQSIDNIENSKNSSNSLDEQSIQNRQQVKKHSFAPKPLKIIKNVIFKKENNHPNDESDDKRKNSDDERMLTSNSLNHLNGQFSVTNLDSETAKNRRRRRQNHSFDNLSDRLQYIESLSNIKMKKKYENEEIKSGFKSEDHLLNKILLPPETVEKINEPNSIKKQQLEILDTITFSKLSDNLESKNKLYSENPIYELIKIDEHSPSYVNTPIFQESNSRPRLSDLNLLRQVKPNKFLNHECTDLTYVNLIFENEHNKYDSINDELRRISSSNSSNSTNSTNSTNADHILMTHDITKSIDLELMRMKKSSMYLKNKRESKSDDESCSKTQYSKIDWIRTDGLLRIRDARKDHHF